MATASKGYTFSPTEQVTDAKLHLMVDGASVSNIVNADIALGAAIGEAKIDLDGSQIVDLTSTQTISGDKIFSGNIYTTDWTDYSATSTIVGWTTFTRKQIYYKKLGKLVFVQYDIRGESNSADLTFTVPYAQQAIVSLNSMFTYGQDDGVALSAFGYMTAGGQVVNFFKDINSSAWTASGTKMISGNFWYESA